MLTSRPGLVASVIESRRHSRRRTIPTHYPGAASMHRQQSFTREPAPLCGAAQFAGTMASPLTSITPTPMAIRIKDKWQQSQRNRPTPKALEDSAQALAFIGWRVALDKAQNLNREGFRFDSDIERVGVISEFVAFEIQIADRCVSEFLSDDDRAQFINALGRRFADHMQDNLSDLDGPRNYRDAFIALLNQRQRDYAGMTAESGEPGFDFLRYCGAKVLDVMGDDQTNRWVLDQIAAVEAPEVAEKIKKSVFNLLSGPPEDGDSGRR